MRSCFRFNTGSRSRGTRGETGVDASGGIDTQRRGATKAPHSLTHSRENDAIGHGRGKHPRRIGKPPVHPPLPWLKDLMLRTPRRWPFKVCSGVRSGSLRERPEFVDERHITAVTTSERYHPWRYIHAPVHATESSSNLLTQAAQVAICLGNDLY